MIGRAYIEIPRTGGVELVPFDAKRPANSPGWGMLEATKTGAFVRLRRPRAMPELTNRGREAMAHTILRTASDGQRNWGRESPELRHELLGYVDEMVVAASEAEERASR